METQLFRKDSLLSALHFIIISFSLSWLIWLPAIFFVPDKYSLPFLLLGSFGPFIAAIILKKKYERTGGLKSWLRISFNFRINAGRYLLAIIILPLAIAGIHHLIYLIMGGKSGFTWDQRWAVYTANLILTALIGGGNEEPGWRGYLTPRLMENFNPLISCALVGIVWVIWHLPLYFLDSWSGGDQPILLFLLYAIPLSVILTWLYNWSKQSIIPVMLLHSATNIIFEYFPRLDIVIRSLSFDFNVLKAVTYWIVALLIIILTKGKLGSVGNSFTIK